MYSRSVVNKMFFCKWCGNIFWPKTYRSKFCSKECKNKHCYLYDSALDTKYQRSKHALSNMRVYLKEKV